MNYEQENDVTMIRTTMRFLEMNQSFVDGIVALRGAQVKLIAKMGELEGNIKIQLEQITGAARDKSAAESEAIDKLVQLLGPAKAYALANADETLYGRFDYSASDLQNTRDTTLDSLLEDLNTAIAGIAVNLRDYGVTDAMLLASASATAAYRTLLTAPRNEINERVAATEAIVVKISEAKNMLYIMDGIVTGQKDLNRRFHDEYFSARVIVDNRGGGGVDVAPVE